MVQLIHFDIFLSNQQVFLPDEVQIAYHQLMVLNPNAVLISTDNSMHFLQVELFLLV
jgi:hypothetical protein